MASGFRYCLLLALLVFTSPAQSEMRDVSPEVLEDVAIKTLRPFFNALKNGNVRQIQSYLTGRKLHQTQGPHDLEYQAMLKEYYKGAVFSIERAIYKDDIIVVDVKIDYSSGISKQTKFYLEEQAQDGDAPDEARKKWMIFDQRNNRVMDL